MHIQRQTHTSTHVHSAHKRNATTRHRSLFERSRRKAFLKTLHTHKKKVRKQPIFTNLKKEFEHIELPAKLLDYFLRSNKSNINQCVIAAHVAHFWERERAINPLQHTTQLLFSFIRDEAGVAYFWLYVHAHVCVCVFVGVCVCMRLYLCMCVRVRLCLCMDECLHWTPPPPPPSPPPLLCALSTLSPLPPPSFHLDIKYRQTKLK